jgi:hypothetical protein
MAAADMAERFANQIAGVGKAYQRPEADDLARDADTQFAALWAWVVELDRIAKAECGLAAEVRKEWLSIDPRQGSVAGYIEIKRRPKGAAYIWFTVRGNQIWLDGSSDWLSSHPNYSTAAVDELKERLSQYVAAYLCVPG